MKRPNGGSAGVTKRRLHRGHGADMRHRKLFFIIIIFSTPKEDNQEKEMQMYELKCEHTRLPSRWVGWRKRAAYDLTSTICFYPRKLTESKTSVKLWTFLLNFSHYAYESKYRFPTYLHAFSCILMFVCFYMMRMAYSHAVCDAGMCLRNSLACSVYYLHF